MSFRWFFVALLAGTSLTPAFAQVSPPPEIPPPPTADQSAPPDPGAADASADAQPADPEGEEDPVYEDDSEEIVVTGQVARGSVIGNMPPELILDRRDIRAYGAGDLAELLDAIAPQTRSTRGRGEGGPVVLLNGRRISGFREIRDIPPEAIDRVEVLPEEVALRYGYRADQRVVNVVLRRRFRAVTTELEFGMPTAGGRTGIEADGNLLRIDDSGRWSLDAEYSRDSALLESERDLIQSGPSRPFDLLGNVGASPFAADAEIDPALSAAAGETVTVTAVPVSAANGPATLADFAAGANSPNVTDLGRFRTLVPETDRLKVGGTLNRTVFGDVSATVNAELELSGSESRLGLPGVDLTVPEGNPFSPFGTDVTLFRYIDNLGPLARRSNGQTAHLGLGLNGDIAPWRWNFTANYDNGRNSTVTDTAIDPAALQARIDAGANPFAAIADESVAFRDQARARSNTQSADATAVFNGPIVRLPAGNLAASVRASVDTRALDSRTVRAGIVQRTDLSRERLAAQANFDIPIASRRREALGPLGDLTANVTAEVEELSDFGTLTTLGYGARWAPIEELDFAVAITDEDGAPTIQQLGEPTVLTPNVRVFDLVQGETVDITRIDGGNPDLLADNRHEFSLRLTARPLSETDLSIVANYTKTRIRNPIASFPTATPEIEAAFPERFGRDSSGQLVLIDARPVNFARSDREELRWGVNFSKSIGPQGPTPEQRAAMREQRRQQRRQGGNPPGPVGDSRAGEPGGQGSRGGRGAGGGRGDGRGFGGFGGGQGGRLQLSVYHTWRFTDEILIRPGVPVLDLLDGSAVGSRGGRPRHELEFDGGYFRNGFGVRLSAVWQSGTTVNGVADGSGGSAGDLRFSDLATFNLRLFADLNQQRSLIQRYRFLRGTRISLSVNNLFDSRLRVTDEAGLVPIGYQPGYLDPLGRSFRITIRKQFFSRPSRPFRN